MSSEEKVLPISNVIGTAVSGFKRGCIAFFKYTVLLLFICGQLLFVAFEYLALAKMKSSIAIKL